MKKLLVAMLFVGLSVGTAQAVTSNPETFETYALTDDFVEMSIGDGAEWYTGWFRFDVTGGLGIWEIIDTSPGNATQVLKQSNTTGWDTKSRWWGDLTSDYQLLAYDVKLVETGELTYNRSMVSPAKWSAYWEYPGMTMLKKASAVTEARLYAGGGDSVAMPGQDSLARGVWYTVEMFTDTVNDQVRARFGPTGGAMNDWSVWVGYTPSYENYDSHTFVSTGEVHYDNIHLTPETEPSDPPPPELLLGDANRDGLVSADDYGSVQLNFGDTGVAGIPGDANLDGVVSADDYGSVQWNFGNTQGVGGVPVPEPGTLALLSVGSLLLIRRKRLYSQR
ncbi:MAG TPA: PEP-CTERM sorting domain-containing protein [Phycisphaerae bacterium]|nr:PEP-CTERM sorting domain-containing protein [Phycisphaerae bacterium]